MHLGPPKIEEGRNSGEEENTTPNLRLAIINGQHTSNSKEEGGGRREEGIIEDAPHTFSCPFSLCICPFVYGA
jgi:hypothetical protein